jgi:hypothetical protein
MYGKLVLSLLYERKKSLVLLSLGANSTISLTSTNSLMFCRDLIVFESDNYSKQIRIFKYKIGGICTNHWVSKIYKIKKIIIVPGFIFWFITSYRVRKEARIAQAVKYMRYVLEGAGSKFREMKVVSSSLKYPDWLWSPTSLTFDGR